MKRIKARSVRTWFLGLSLWGRGLVLLLVVHLIVCAIRLPRNVQKKRLEISEYAQTGTLGWPFRNDAPAKTETLELLLGTTHANSILYYEGSQKGDLEFAAALLYPRLLIPFGTKNPEWFVGFDRFPASIGDSNGQGHTPVLRGGASSLELDLR